MLNILSQQEVTNTGIRVAPIQKVEIINALDPTAQHGGHTCNPSVVWCPGEKITWT